MLDCDYGDADRQQLMAKVWSGFPWPAGATIHGWT
jgi:hypothetical protein